MRFLRECIEGKEADAGQDPEEYQHLMFIEKEELAKNAEDP